MGFRFRKSIRLFPGVRVNLSKSTPSVSLGGPGHTINLSERGTRATVGLSGTGLSYSQRVEPAIDNGNEVSTSGSRAGLIVAILLIAVVAVLVALLR